MGSEKREGIQRAVELEDVKREKVGGGVGVGWELKQAQRVKGWYREIWGL